MRLFLFYTMILLYIAAGINHFINPEFYLKIMPSYIPCKMFNVFFSGILEIAFSVLLLFNSTRKIAAWLIVIMLIVFFTVHIQMLVDNWSKTGILFWLLLLRILFQFVLIYWAYYYTKFTKSKQSQY